MLFCSRSNRRFTKYSSFSDFRSFSISRIRLRIQSISSGRAASRSNPRSSPRFFLAPSVQRSSRRPNPVVFGARNARPFLRLIIMGRFFWARSCESLFLLSFMNRKPCFRFFLSLVNNLCKTREQFCIFLLFFAFCCFRKTQTISNLLIEIPACL